MFSQPEYIRHQEIESLRQQLAEIHELNDNHAFNAKYFKAEYEKIVARLAECERERERDELKTWLEDQVCEAKDFAYKLEGKTVELATVTKERDELVEALDEIRRTHYPAGVLAIADAALAKVGAGKTGEKE